MMEKNEYYHLLEKLYSKSLILESTSEFQQVLYFHFIDAIAHVDYSLCQLAFNYQSPRNIMNMQYMRWRIDEEKKGDRICFAEFINWLKAENQEKYESLPALWKEIYDESSPVCYRSFRIVLNPGSYQPVPAGFFQVSIEELFSQKFIRSLYKDASLGMLFDEFMQTKKQE